MKTRLLYLVSHPIQYQAPLLRLISNDPEIALKVVFENVDTASTYYDPGFDRDITWDVSLLDGYDSSPLSDINLRQVLSSSDVLWMHGWQSWTARKTLYLADKINLPVLMRAENWEGAMPDGSGLKGWLKAHYLQWIFKRCRAFLAIGSLNKAYYLNRGVSGERIFSMPYGIDNDFFREHAIKAEQSSLALRDKHGLLPDQPVILVPGKLIERKHPELALHAWRHLIEQKKGEKISKQSALLFAGDGPLAATLMSEAESYEAVKFLGFCNQTELPALYNLADVVVIPSEEEPWGLVVNEAMACGTAVIASDQVGSAYDLIGQNTDEDILNVPGLMVPSGDESALANALDVVLQHSGAMGQAAIKKVAQFDFNHQIAGLKEAILAVCRDENKL